MKALQKILYVYFRELSFMVAANHFVVVGIGCKEFCNEILGVG